MQTLACYGIFQWSLARCKCPSVDRLSAVVQCPLFVHHIYTPSKTTTLPKKNQQGNNHFDWERKSKRSTILKGEWFHFVSGAGLWVAEWFVRSRRAARKEFSWNKTSKTKRKNSNQLDAVTQKQLEQQTHIELETTRDESQGPKWRLIFFNVMVEKTGRI